MKKKMLGILMGVAMTATTIAAPTAIFADDIDIEDIAVETEEDDVADVEVEDEAEPAEEVAAEDDFSAEADDAEGFFTDAEAADFEAQNAKVVVSADVIASAVDAENISILDPEHITVYSKAAEDMGYQDKVDQETAVSTLDVLVTMHKKKYPSMTSATAENYLKLWYQESLTAGGAWIDKMFGVETTAVSFAVNGLAPDTGEIYKDANGNPTNDYVGKMVNEAAVENGDVVDFFFYKDTQSYSDMYAYFADDNGNFLKSLTVTPGETYTLNVKAYAYKMYSLSIPSWRNLFVENAPSDYTVVWVSNDLDNPLFIEDGKVTFTVPADASGTYSLLGEITGAPAYRYVNPHLEIKVG